MTRTQTLGACLLGLMPTVVVSLGCVLRPDLASAHWPQMLGLALASTVLLTLTVCVGWWLTRHLVHPQGLRRALEVLVGFGAVLIIGVPGTLFPLLLPIFSPLPPDTQLQPLLKTFPE